LSRIFIQNYKSLKRTKRNTDKHTIQGVLLLEPLYLVVIFPKTAPNEKKDKQRKPDEHPDNIG